MYSYRDHSLFLTKRGRYSFLFNYRDTDYKKWAHGLRKAGYATDKRYPQKLISLIERHNLSRFDKAYAKHVSAKKSEIVQNDQRTVTSKVNKVYEVQKGDTLYSISRKYSVSVADLKRWNYMYDNNISVGQKLTVGSEKYN